MAWSERKYHKVALTPGESEVMLLFLSGGSSSKSAMATKSKTSALQKTQLKE